MRGKRLAVPGIPIPGTKAYNRFIETEGRRIQFDAIQGSLDKLERGGFIERVRPRSNLERMVSGDDD